MSNASDSFGDSSRPSVVLTFGQLWQIPTFLFGLLILGTVWGTRPLWYDPDGLRFQHELSSSRHAIESGTGIQEATQLLSDALTHSNEHPRHKGEVQFLLGSAYVRLAENATGDRARGLWQQALHYFDEARGTGVSESDALPLVYHSARARFYTDSSQDALKRVIFDLSVCVEKMPDQRWEAFGILTQANLKLTPPDTKAALLANERQLQLPLEDERLLDPVRLLRGELLLNARDPEEARRTLSRIGAKAPMALLQRARYLRAQSFQDDKLWLDASSLWKEILADARLPKTEKSHALYCLGLCYQNLEDLAAAEKIWQQAILQGGEESRAAEVYLAEIRVRGKKFKEAAAAYEKILAKVEKPADYQWKLIPLAKLAGDLELACQEAEKAGALEEAYRLARLFSRIARPDVATLVLARIAEAQANASKDVRDYKEAGRAYEAAAAAIAPGSQEQYLLWSAAKNMLQAREYKYAVEVIEHYTALKPSTDGISEAYYRMGEAEQALVDATNPNPLLNPDQQDKPTRAEEIWSKCYEKTGTFANRAGVKLALALQRRNKFDEAEKILQKIVLDPHTDEAQEEAMFTLASIHYQKANYVLAANTWVQALNTYKNSRFALPAQYQLGECYRRQADAEGFRPNQIKEFQTGPRSRSHNSYLDRAISAFLVLVNNIQAKREGAKLTPAETDLLRKGLFALGECYFEHGQYKQARHILERFAADYADRIESYDALRLLHDSYVADNPANFAKALEMLAEMERTLNNLPDSAFKDRLQGNDREHCLAWIKTQRAELERLNPATNQKGPETNVLQPQESQIK
jgi:TolA-binding protein